MKTGKAANLFGKDSNTINNWVDRYSTFFSVSGRGQGQSQRDFTPEDLIVLNTIKYARDHDNAGWEEIRARLEAQDFITELPAGAMNIQAQDAVTIYTDYKRLELRLEVAEQERQRLQKELDLEREMHIKDVARLNQEVGKWRALAEYFENRDDKKEEG